MNWKVNCGKGTFQNKTESNKLLLKAVLPSCKSPPKDLVKFLGVLNVHRNPSNKALKSVVSTLANYW